MPPHRENCRKKFYAYLNLRVVVKLNTIRYIEAGLLDQADCRETIGSEPNSSKADDCSNPTEGNED